MNLVGRFYCEMMMMITEELKLSLPQEKLAPRNKFQATPLLTHYRDRRIRTTVSGDFNLISLSAKSTSREDKSIPLC